MPYKAIIDADAVHRQLLGLQDEIGELDADDVELLTADAITAAQNEFEEDLQIWLYPRKILTFPTNLDTIGVTYDVQEDQYDYYTSTYSKTANFQLKHRPVISIQRMAVEYGAGALFNLFTYPTSWLRVNHKLGTVTIVPAVNLGQGLAVSPGAEFYLPLLRGGWLKNVVPIMVSIDYTAGIADADTNPNYAELRMRLAQAAGLYLRDSIMDMIVGSASRDGVSSAYQSSQAHADRIRENLNNPQTGWKRRWQDKHRPIPMVFV